MFLFLVLTSENLLLINLLMRADFPTFESPMRTTLQSWRASVNRCLTLPIFEIFLSDWINFVRASYSGKQHGHLMSSLWKIYDNERVHSAKTWTELKVRFGQKDNKTHSTTTRSPSPFPLVLHQRTHTLSSLEKYFFKFGHLCNTNSALKMKLWSIVIYKHHIVPLKFC